MNKFKITTEIQNLLLENKDIEFLIGTKIFPIVANKGTEGDYIVYQRDGYKQEETKMGVAIQIPTVFVDAVSTDYNSSQELASLIYETLEGEFTNPDMTIHLEDSTEDYIDGKYIQTLQFSIR